MRRMGSESKMGGWKSAAFIIAVEMAERFSFYGITSGLVGYLTVVMGHSTASAAKTINVWQGVSFLCPILGAYVADSVLGRFMTVLVSSLIYLLGLVLLFLSAAVMPSNVRGPFLYVALYVIALGEGGHKPSVQTFAADQFNENTAEEKAAKTTFFNWWFFGIVFGAASGMGSVFYVQSNVGWAAGFGIPAGAMTVALVLFIAGFRYYRREASPPTSQWRLCTWEQAKEASRLLPIWFFCFPFSLATAQQFTFFTKQATTMKPPSLASHLRIPTSFIPFFASILLTLTAVVLYERVFVKLMRKITGNPAGVTTLQRIGVGHGLSVISLLSAALVERKRVGATPDPLSVWWLLPQYGLLGLAEIFAAVGMQQLFYERMPVELRSLGAAAYLSIVGLGSFMSSGIIEIVQAATSSWLVPSDLDKAHLDNFYFLLTLLCAVGLLGFVWAAHRFQEPRSEEHQEI